MSRTVFLQAYFNTFHGFLDQLSQVFPGDLDLPSYKAALSLIQRTNPMMAVSQVMETIAPFESMIVARDADFFMKYGYSEFTAADTTLDPLIQKLKTMWGGLTPKNQEVVWDYITSLLQLGKKCQSM